MYPVYNSIFDYLRAVEYNLYNSTIVPTSWRVRSVCVVCVSSSHLFCGRTSRGHTRSPHLPSAVIARIFIARRIQPSLSLVTVQQYIVQRCCIKKKTVKKLLLIEILHIYHTLRASGDSQTHTFTLFLSLPCPFLATMSFAGYFLVGFFCLLSLLFFSEIIPGLFWFSSVYLVTIAGFVADS